MACHRSSGHLGQRDVAGGVGGDEVEHLTRERPREPTAPFALLYQGCDARPLAWHRLAAIDNTKQILVVPCFGNGLATKRHNTPNRKKTTGVVSGCDASFPFCRQ